MRRTALDVKFSDAISSSPCTCAQHDSLLAVAPSTAGRRCKQAQLCNRAVGPQAQRAHLPSLLLLDDAEDLGVDLLQRAVWLEQPSLICTVPAEALNGRLSRRRSM